MNLIFVECQRIRIEMKLTVAVLPWTKTGLKKHRMGQNHNFMLSVLLAKFSSRDFFFLMFIQAEKRPNLVPVKLKKVPNNGSSIRQSDASSLKLTSSFYPECWFSPPHFFSFEIKT